MPATDRPAFQGLRLAPPFAEEVAGPGTQARVAFHTPRGPGDLDGLDAGGLAQAEVEPRVARRLVAAAAGAPGHAAPAAGDDRDPRPDGVAVGAATLQAEGQRPAPFGPVVEVGQRLVMRQDQHVLPAVVVEIAHDQAAPMRGTRQGGRPGRRHQSAGRRSRRGGVARASGKGSSAAGR